MNTTIVRIVIAVVFAAAAWLSRSEAQLAARVADTSLGLATFDYDAVSDELPDNRLLDRLPGQRRPLADEVRIARASMAYWMGRYDAVAADTRSGDADATVLLTTANAAFRAAQRDPGVGPAAVQRLDGVLQAYASAMRVDANGPVGREAAYNYEYVARVRDEVARAQGKRTTPGVPAPVALSAADLPVGPTIHGRPGGPPPEAKMEELQMIAPMEFGDREAQPEATPGGKRERKG